MPRYVISPEVRVAVVRVTGISPETALADSDSGYRCAVCNRPGDHKTAATTVLFADDPRGASLIRAHAECAPSRVTTLAELALDQERAGVPASAMSEPPPLAPGWWARHPALFLDDLGAAIENRNGKIVNVLAEGAIGFGFSRPDPAKVPPRTHSGFVVRLAGSTIAGIGDGERDIWKPGGGSSRLPANWVRAMRREGTVVLVMGDLGFPVAGPFDADALAMDRIQARAVCGLLPVRP